MNPFALVPLALLLAGAAAPEPKRPATAAPLLPATESPDEAPPEAGTFTAPPPGASKEDAALWWKAKEINVRVPVERGVSTRLQAKVNGSRWQERLAEGVKRGTLTEKRAGELQKKLLADWNAMVLILSAQWPVDPTRVCGYPWLELDNLLQQPDSPFRQRALPDARGRLQECVEAATRIQATLARANGEFERAFAAIDEASPVLPPVGPAAKAPAAAPSSTPPASDAAAK